MKVVKSVFLQAPSIGIPPSPQKGSRKTSFLCYGGGRTLGFVIDEVAELQRSSRQADYEK